MTADPWGGLEPRRWQAEALPVVMGELVKGGGPLVWACTGAGKSIFQRAVIASVLSRPRPGVVVVDVPSQALVRQLASTLDAHPLLTGRVGQFYGERKRLHEDGVIVVCRASLDRLQAEIVGRGWPVRLYMADEAHVSPDRQAAFLAAVEPARRIGVTATPFRSDVRDSLSLWDRVVVEYGLPDAIRDGVLVPFRSVVWDGESGEVDDVCREMMRAHAHIGPMLANATDIADAEGFAEHLRRGGVEALAIHSGQTTKERDRLAGMLRDGQIAALVHVATLVEGVDWPWLRVLCLRRQAYIRARALADGEGGGGGEAYEDGEAFDPSLGGSRVRLVQEVGRTLRASEGKTEAVILDPMGVCDLIGLAHGSNIGGEAEERKKAEREEEAKPREVKARDLVMVYGASQIMAWISQAHQFAEMAGVIERSRGRRWRVEAASQRQIDALGKAAAKRRIYLPRTIAHMVRAAMDMILASPGTASKGAASDVLGLIMAGQTAYFDEKDRIGRWPEGEDYWRAVVPPLPGGITIKD
jgi:superfamily II DNA or RNA helicase